MVLIRVRRCGGRENSLVGGLERRGPQFYEGHLTSLLSSSQVVSDDDMSSALSCHSLTTTRAFHEQNTDTIELFISPISHRSNSELTHGKLDRHLSEVYRGIWRPPQSLHTSSQPRHSQEFRNHRKTNKLTSVSISRRRRKRHAE